jgi:hypothetical protein
MLHFMGMLNYIGHHDVAKNRENVDTCRRHHRPVSGRLVRLLDHHRLARAQDEADHEPGDPQAGQVLRVLLVVADQYIPKQIGLNRD